MPNLYDTSLWREYRSRVLSADAECAFARLAGDCRGVLHLHHVDPLAEGGPAFPDEGGMLVVPILEERLVVRTELVVKEELRIRRRERAEHVTIPVRLRSERAEVTRSEGRGPNPTDSELRKS